MFYNQNVEEVIQKFSSHKQNGLSEAQVKINQRIYGLNKIEKVKAQSIFVKFLLKFKDTLSIILLFAAIISIVVNPDDIIDSIIIFIVLIINAFLGVIQEYNAQKALDSLEKMASPYAKVIRSGLSQSIETSKVVPGDILLLEAGDIVPSDARLIEAYNLKVDESSLTGESFPVEKNSQVIAINNIPLADRLNMVYASCNVTYGRAKAIVIASGKQNEIGKIATSLTNTKKQTTPLQIKLDQIGKTIGFICIIICVIVFVMELLNGLAIMNAFKTAVALAVAAVPEGLATVVTVILALSVQRMVKQNAIIKNLPAVETLGSTSIICSDKTGTLTQNKMKVTKAYVEGSKVFLVGQAKDDNLTRLLNYFTICSDGKISEIARKKTEIGDPTEIALVKASLDLGFTKDDLAAKFKRFNEIPFDSKRKMMTVFVKTEQGIISITKGAPDVIFSRCKNIDLEAAKKINADMSKEALRVLALGIRKWTREPDKYDSDKIENDMTFMGLVGMIDPPRKEVKEAIAKASRAGVKTIMITGDHIITACAIAKKLGIIKNDSEAIMGQELDKYSDDELIDIIDKFSVYSRVAPEHKVRIVKAWQKRGKVVAMTGDGVNDAPALKKADIGCAMGITGSDVAKGAASMILTDDNFTTIVNSIKEGRGIYDNIRKTVQFLLSSNIGEVILIFSVAFISLVNNIFGLFTTATGEISSVPLLPIHLLWINLITDTLPAFALGFEPVEDDVMKRRPRDKDENFFSNGLGIRILLQGIMIGFLTLIAYFIGNRVNHETGMTMAFITLCMTELIHAFNVKTNKSIIGKRALNNKYLGYAFLIGVLLQVIIFFIKPLRIAFKLVIISSYQLGICLLLALMTVIICEIAKFLKRITSKSRN